MKKVRIEKNLGWLTTDLEEYRKEQTIHLTPATLKSYLFDIGAFITWLKIYRQVSVTKQILPQHVKDYLSDRKAKGAAQTSVHRYYMAIKHFDQWALGTRRRTGTFMYQIKPPRYTQQMKSVPSEQDINAIIDATSQTSFPLRNRAVVELFYSCGLRLGEFTALKLSDYDGKSLHVRFSKSGVSRTVPLTKEAIKWLEKYLDEERGDTDSDALFVSLQGRDLSRQTIYSMIKDIGEIAGFKDITPHTFRHACATHLMNAGAHMRTIQDVLGHQSIKSTERYTSLSNAQRDTVFLATHPRNNIKNEV